MKKKILKTLILLVVMFVTMGIKKANPTNIISSENDKDYWTITIILSTFLFLFTILVLRLSFILEHPTNHHNHDNEHLKSENGT